MEKIIGERMESNRAKIVAILNDYLKKKFCIKKFVNHLQLNL